MFFPKIKNERNRIKKWKKIDEEIGKKNKEKEKKKKRPSLGLTLKNLIQPPIMDEEDSIMVEGASLMEEGAALLKEKVSLLKEGASLVAEGEQDFCPWDPWNPQLEAPCDSQNVMEQAVEVHCQNSCAHFSSNTSNGFWSKAFRSILFRPILLG